MGSGVVWSLVVGRGGEVSSDVRCRRRKRALCTRFVFLLQVFGCYGNNNAAGLPRRNTGTGSGQSIRKVQMHR
jgi:hypothetical protein